MKKNNSLNKKGGYTKSELAKLYFPYLAESSALKQFNIWVWRDKELAGLLRSRGLTPLTRRYTPRQIEIIFDYLGEPFL